MRRYETIFIVRPNIGEDEIEAITSRAAATIEGDGGTIIRINNWGLKKLAYLIKKENQGYYVYVDYAGVPASVAEIERIFRIDDRILKYLTVKLADSCDPEAVKEQIASAEPVPVSDAESMEDKKTDSTDEEKTDTVEEEKSGTVEEEKSDSADEEKTETVEEEKSDSADEEKTDTVEEEKSDSTDEEKTDTVEEEKAD